MDGVASLRVPPGKSTELLVRLALEAGAEIRTEKLIDDLWGDETAERNTVQSKVSMLRRALGESLVISGTRTGYTLDIEPESVDAIAVLAQLVAAQAFLAAGDAERALGSSTAALQLFKGEVLPDAGDAQWVAPYRTRLEEVRLALLETKIESALAVGSPASVIGELEDLVAQYPLREGLWVLLITALYRDQRQADALAAYRRIRDALDDELGLSPGPRLRVLEQMVLEQDPSLDSPTAARQPATRRERGNLPGLTSELVGRGADVDAVASAIAGRRLVTIVGPAGVGKTRLAIEVARGDIASESAWLVRLEAADSPTRIAAVIGDALGLNGATESMIIDRLRSEASLIVFDNCEHVVDAVADFVSRMLDDLPAVRLLATSQLPLDLDGEFVYSLQPLPLDASMELFTQRSSGRRGSGDGDAEAVVAIEGVCRALDGLPLAIELAAARTKALSVQEIARRLDDRFGLLSDPSGRRPERHRALSTAISWSYDLLFPDEKQVLCAVACFADGGPLAAVEFVASELGVPTAATVDALGRLADRSLVTVQIGAEGNVRYRLLDSVRAFALERLTEAGTATVARSAHAGWFADRADVAASDERRPEQKAHLVFVRTERANIDLALQWSSKHDSALGIRIVKGFGWYWVILGEAQVAAERINTALSAAEGTVAPEDRAYALSSIAWNEAGADLAKALAAGEAGVTAADVTSIAPLMAEARMPLAFALMHSGRAAESIAMLQSWRAGSASTASPWHVGVSCMLLGYAGLVSGDAKVAAEAATEGKLLLPLCEDGWLTSHIESIRGQLSLAAGDVDSATEHLMQAAQAGRDTGLLATEAFHLVALGRVQQIAGQLEEAIETLRSAIDSARSVGLMRVVSLAQVSLGRLLIQTGDPGDARTAIAAASQWFAASGGGEDAALAECLLVTLDSAEARPGSQERLAGRLEAARQQKNAEVTVLCLDAMALHSIVSGEPESAVSFLRQADEIAPTVAHRVTPQDRFDADRARALLTAASS